MASVCKEWQVFIEQRNFRRLKLHAPCLIEFERLMQCPRRRRLVRYICLDVQLPEYSCGLCGSGNYQFMRAQNSSIVSNAILKLFRILSTWEPRPEPETRGKLTLELNAHSPSDWKHCHKNWHFAPDHETGVANSRSSSSWHDPQHGWVNGRQVKDPPFLAVMQQFLCINLNCEDELPLLEVVTTFIIRRQLRRGMGRYSLTSLLKKLPGLEDLIYEPWQERNCYSKAIRDMGAY